jgi:hypothetical protein
MEKPNQNRCQCEKASCACAGTKVESCNCGPDCDCSRACNCAGPCDCADAK